LSPETVRLQKLLSAAGVASRRAAERLITDGRVSVNGKTILELGAKASPADDIGVDGRRVSQPATLRYILLNKPVGVVTTRSDPQRRPTVLTVIGDLAGYVYPVGRLDYDSEGLLLLTNDGELAARLTHPRHEVPKVYQARVRGTPDEQTLARLARGVMIDGRRTAPAQVRVLPSRSKFEAESTVEMTLREGRNRQVRRMFETVGHRVHALRRVQFGPLRDPKLKPGMFRELTSQEVAALKRAATTASPPSPPRTRTASDSRPRRSSPDDRPRRG
jgi:pseudouridine synthase